MFLNDIIFSTNLCDGGVLVNFPNLFSSGSGANISPTEMYLIEFENELSIPSGNVVTISPSGYTIRNSKSFTPQCVAKIKSEYTEGSQTLIKLVVKDINYNVLKTQYKRIICSAESGKPCFFPVQQPRDSQYITLNQRNNWEYRYNGYMIAKFSPQAITDNISIKLPKKDVTYLPSKGRNDQLIITIPVSKLAEYRFTAEGIKQILGGNTAYTQEDEDIIFVLDALGRTIEQVSNIQLSSFSSGTSQSPIVIFIKSIGTVEFNTPKEAPIPTPCSVRLLNSQNSTTTDLGQLIINPKTYQISDEIIVTYNGNSIIGKIDSPLLLLKN